MSLALTVLLATSAAIDVRDLPPLPSSVNEEASTSVTVVAATQAEEDIVVGAAKREQSLGSVASAVTVLSADRLRRFGYRTLSEALRGVAGLYVVDDRMTERLGIRGLQILGDFNTRILVLVDGATLNEPWNQYVGIGIDLPVSLDEVERIEVVRGPVSSVYGTNAFFGIINIVTRGADRSPRVYGRLGASTFGKATGSAGFALGEVNRQLRGSFAFTYRRGETLDIDGVGHTSADGAQALSASLVGHLGGAFAQLRAYRDVRELPGAPYGSLVGDRRNQNSDEMIMAEGGYAREVGPVTLTGRAYLNRYRFTDFLALAPEPNFHDIGDSSWAGGEARVRWAVLGERLGLTAGAEVTFNKVESHSYDDSLEANTRVPTSFNIEGVYGEVDGAPLSWASFNAGLRFDRNSKFESSVSPRLALLIHDAERFGLKLLYARGFRNPSPLEAFFEDQMEFIANPDLQPEHITSYEAVAWGRPIPGVNLRLSAFRWDLSDITELTDVGGGLFQFQNIFAMRSQGFEAEATYRDTRGFYGFASATLAFVERDGKRPPNAPVAVAAAGISTPKLFKLVHASAELQLVGSRHTRDPMLDSPAHLGLNVALYAPRWKGLDLTLGARNLLGTREQIPAQTDYDRPGNPGQPVYIIPGEGLEVYARVGYSL